jgi:hypothetical protein
LRRTWIHPRTPQTRLPVGAPLAAYLDPSADPSPVGAPLAAYLDPPADPLACRGAACGVPGSTPQTHLACRGAACGVPGSTPQTPSPVGAPLAAYLDPPATRLPVGAPLAAYLDPPANPSPVGAPLAAYLDPSADPLAFQPIVLRAMVHRPGTPQAAPLPITQVRRKRALALNCNRPNTTRADGNRRDAGMGADTRGKSGWPGCDPTPANAPHRLLKRFARFLTAARQNIKYPLPIPHFDRQQLAIAYNNGARRGTNRANDRVFRHATVRLRHAATAGQ